MKADGRRMLIEMLTEEQFSSDVMILPHSDPLYSVRKELLPSGKPTSRRRRGRRMNERKQQMKSYHWPTIVKIGIVFTLVLFGVIQTVIHTPAALASCTPECDFTFTTSASNTSTYIATIDEPNINNQPNLLLFITQTWPSAYDAHPIGVWFNSSTGRWTIFNEDLKAMPLGVSFEVLFLANASGPGWSNFHFTATVANSHSDFALIDNPLTNNNTRASIEVTQLWQGTYNPHEVGIYYNQFYRQWAVFNEDQTPIPAGAVFNLTMASSPPWNSYVHQATSANTNGYITYIDNPLFNDQGPSTGRFVEVTQVYNPSGTCGCVLNNHTIGVWYNPVNNQWSVYNVDLSPLPLGAQFIVNSW
jgi:hypothetical protein